MPGIDRRQFLASSLLALPPAPLPILDTHQHLWDLDKFRLNWVAKKSFLDRNYLPADYDEAVKGLHVQGTVYLEVDVDPSQQLAEAEAVSAQIRSGKTLTRAAIISGRPDSDDFPAYVRRFKGSTTIKGIRRVLHGGETPAGHCLGKTFVRNITFLGELGLHYELCMRPGELTDARKLVAACPDTRFVLDHCGNPDLKKTERWKKDIADLARLPNVVGKVSGIVASAEPKKWKPADLAPVVLHTLEVFGPDRVMFGSDWPVCLKTATLRQWVEALQEIVADRPEAERRKLFHDNAIRVYRLTRG